MGYLDEQIQREQEFVRLALDIKEAKKTSLNLVALEFEAEISKIERYVELVKQQSRTPSDPSEIAYAGLLYGISSHTLAENLLRAIFEGLLTAGEEEHATTPTIQFIVKNLLIDRRLKSLMPPLEREIPVQAKFRQVDRLLFGAITMLPNLFTLCEKTEKDRTVVWIKLQQQGKTRLGHIPPNDILIDTPMLCHPKDWTGVFNGGFITPEAQRGNSLVSSKYYSYKDLLAVDASLQQHGEVLAAINKIQDVEFKIADNYEEHQTLINDIRKKKVAKCDEEITKCTKRILEIEEMLRSEISEQSTP